MPKKSTRRRVKRLRNAPNDGRFFTCWTTGPKPEYGPSPCPVCGDDVNPGERSLFWKADDVGGRYAHVGRCALLVRERGFQHYTPQGGA